MSANIPANGPIRQLDKRAEPDELLTEEQANDPKRVARLLLSMLRDVAQLKRRWLPRRIDFEDRIVDATGTIVYRLQHGFGGRVRWWVVDWTGASNESRLVRHSSSTDNTLALVSYTVGIATIRIEEAGP